MYGRGSTKALYWYCMYIHKLLCVYGGLVAVVPAISREQPIAVSFRSSEPGRAGSGEAAALLLDPFSDASQVGELFCTSITTA